MLAAILFTSSTNVFLFSTVAVMSRKTSSSAPCCEYSMASSTGSPASRTTWAAPCFRGSRRCRTRSSGVQRSSPSPETRVPSPDEDPMRQPFIAGNWKMFKTVHEAVVHVKELRSLVKDVRGVEIVVAPPATALHAVAEAARNSNIAVAGQNCHWEREGAFTGEVSARHGARGGRRVRRSRPLRAAHALRRHRPVGEPEDARRARGWARRRSSAWAKR